MPSKSKSQQRFFGMVDAYKKGEMKNASKKIKKVAKGMSMDDVKDFAETKHKGLPEKVEENIMNKKLIRLTENDLHKIVKESVTKMLHEAENGGWVVDSSEVQEAYDLAANEWGEDYLNQAIVRSLGTERLAECLAYVFRMYDFRQWKER